MKLTKCDVEGDVPLCLKQLTCDLVLSGEWFWILVLDGGQVWEQTGSWLKTVRPRVPT